MAADLQIRRLIPAFKMAGGLQGRPGEDRKRRIDADVHDPKVFTRDRPALRSETGAEQHGLRLYDRAFVSVSASCPIRTVLPRIASSWVPPRLD
jgi:hypothetical protein